MLLTSHQKLPATQMPSSTDQEQVKSAFSSSSSEVQVQRDLPVASEPTKRRPRKLQKKTRLQRSMESKGNIRSRHEASNQSDSISCPTGNPPVQAPESPRALKLNPTSSRARKSSERKRSRLTAGAISQPIPQHDIEGYYSLRNPTSRLRPILDQHGNLLPSRTPQSEQQLPSSWSSTPQGIGSGRSYGNDTHSTGLTELTRGSPSAFHEEPASNQPARPARTSSLFNLTRILTLGEDGPPTSPAWSLGTGEWTYPEEDVPPRNVEAVEFEDERLEATLRLPSTTGQATAPTYRVGEIAAEQHSDTVSRTSNDVESVTAPEGGEETQPASIRCSPLSDDTRLWLKYHKHLVENVMSPRNSQNILDPRRGRSMTAPSVPVPHPRLDRLQVPSRSRAGSHRSSLSDGSSPREPLGSSSQEFLGSSSREHVGEPVQSHAQGIQRGRQAHVGGPAADRTAAGTSMLVKDWAGIRPEQQSKSSEAQTEMQLEHRPNRIVSHDWALPVVPPAQKPESSQGFMAATSKRALEALSRRRESLMRRYPAAPIESLFGIEQRADELLIPKKPYKSASLGTLRSASDKVKSSSARVRGLIKPAPGKAVVLGDKPAKKPDERVASEPAVPPVPKIPAKYLKQNMALRQSPSERSLQSHIGAPVSLDLPRKPWLKYEPSSSSLSGKSGKSSLSTLQITLPEDTTVPPVALPAASNGSPTSLSSVSSDRSIHPAFRPGFEIDNPASNVAGSQSPTIRHSSVVFPAPAHHPPRQHSPPSYPPPNHPPPAVPRASLSLFPRQEETSRRMRAATDVGARSTTARVANARTPLPMAHSTSSVGSGPATQRRGTTGVRRQDLEHLSPLSSVYSDSIENANQAPSALVSPQAARPGTTSEKTYVDNALSGDHQRMHDDPHLRPPTLVNSQRSSGTTTGSVSPALVPDEQRISSSWMPTLPPRHRRNLTAFDDFLETP